MTLHVLYGKRASERTAELRAIARWMRRWADEASDFNQNLIALDDFNIDREGDRTTRPSPARGCGPRPSTPDCRAPCPCCAAASSTTRSPGSTQGGRRKLTLGYEGSGGNFEFDQYVMRRMERVPLSYRISDHYPLWVEFLVPPPG